MKLIDCINIGNECGLHTLEECYDNIELHSTNIFAYNKLAEELLELQKEIYFYFPSEFLKMFETAEDEMNKKGWIKNPLFLEFIIK